MLGLPGFAPARLRLASCPRCLPCALTGYHEVALANTNARMVRICQFMSICTTAIARNTPAANLSTATNNERLDGIEEDLAALHPSDAGGKDWTLQPATASLPVPVFSGYFGGWGAAGNPRAGRPDR